jgi:endoglucanase
MKKILALLLLASAALFALPAQTPGPLSHVRVEKNKFIDAQGQVIIFKGVNLSDPDKLERSGHWTREYFAKAKEWGANIVRFPIHPQALNSRGYEAYFALVDKGVSWAEELGMYVIIDWHSIGNLAAEKFQAESYKTTKKETLEFWRFVTERYKNRDAVAFYEIFNEPTDFGGSLGKASWPEWKAINEEIITIIYGIDKSKIPLVAGFNWAYDLTPVKQDPIAFEGVAYVSHPYPMKREKPWVPQWEKDWGFVADTYPVMLTEIGYCFKGDKGAHIPVMTDETYGPALVNYCKEKGISWVVWVFDPDWAPMMFSDWNYTPTRQGEFFRNVMQGR